MLKLFKRLVFLDRINTPDEFSILVSFTSCICGPKIGGIDGGGGGDGSGEGGGGGGGDGLNGGGDGGSGYNLISNMPYLHNG